MEHLHPEITFGTPQTWVRVKLKDVLDQDQNVEPANGPGAGSGPSVGEGNGSSEGGLFKPTEK